MQQGADVDVKLFMDLIVKEVVKLYMCLVSEPISHKISHQHPNP